MGDSLRQLGQRLGQTQREVEFIARRGGLLPALERTRGNLLKSNAFIANFRVEQTSRKVSLKLAFYKASIL